MHIHQTAAEPLAIEPQDCCHSPEQGCLKVPHPQRPPRTYSALQTLSLERCHYWLMWRHQAVLEQGFQEGGHLHVPL